MTRLEKLHTYKTNAHYGKLWAKLKPEEIKICEDFIAQHNHLDFTKFEEKVNRIFLDQPKPKNVGLIQEFVSLANLASKEIISPSSGGKLSTTNEGSPL